MTPWPRNLTELYHEAPAFAVCGIICTVFIMLSPQEGGLALLSRSITAIFIIPCTGYWWRHRKRDRYSLGGQIPRLCVLAALSAAILISASVCLDLIGGSKSLITSEFHIRSDNGGFRLVLPDIRQEFPIDNHHYHPLAAAREIHVEYWPQSGIIKRLDILGSR